MKKSIIVIIILLLLGVGGWYLYLQQGGEHMNNGEEIEENDEQEEGGEGENGEIEDEEIEEDIPYHEREETSVISGPNEEKHEIFTEVFESVFEESKLTSNDADTDDPLEAQIDYWGDMQYFVPGEIEIDDAKKAQEKLEEEGFEFTFCDTGAESYFCEYDFEMSGEECSGMIFFILGEGGDSEQGSINIDFQITN